MSCGGRYVELRCRVVLCHFVYAHQVHQVADLRGQSRAYCLPCLCEDTFYQGSKLWECWNSAPFCQEECLFLWYSLLGMILRTDSWHWDVLVGPLACWWWRHYILWEHPETWSQGHSFTSMKNWIVHYFSYEFLLFLELCWFYPPCGQRCKWTGPFVYTLGMSQVSDFCVMLMARCMQWCHRMCGRKLSRKM